MKNLIKSLSAVLFVASSIQMAVAAPSHHQSRTQRATVQQQRSNADAYASWPAGQPDVYQSGPAFSGGYSAPAGR